MRKKSLSPEIVARNLLGKSTYLVDGQQREVQISGIAYLFEWRWESELYGKWNLIDTENLNPKRGRPSKEEQVRKVEIKKPENQSLVHTEKEIKKIEGKEFIFDRFEDIDGSPVPVFKKVKKKE